jgi:hypothetical protein
LAYDRLSLDATLARRRPIVVGQQFVLSDKLLASFYPDVATGIRVDNIHLAPTRGSRRWSTSRAPSPVSVE